MSATRPTPWAIRAFRCLRLALHMVALGLGAAIIYPRVSRVRRAELKMRWSLQLLAILAVRLDTRPTDAPPGSLIVANHVSWLDIFTINGLRPAAFIAKAEIRQWPFVGWLAARNDTVFLRRGSRGHARLVNSEIDALLNTGTDVAVFPEGMTSDGTQVLGFHAALLQPAIETGRPVLPLAISYHEADGSRSLAPSFAGQTTLAQSFAAILACRALTVRLSAAALIETPGKTRREVSEAAHAAIAACLATRPGLRPPSNRPEKSPCPQGV